MCAGGPCLTALSFPGWAAWAEVLLHWYTLPALWYPSLYGGAIGALHSFTSMDSMALIAGNLLQEKSATSCLVPLRVGRISKRIRDRSLGRRAGTLRKKSTGQVGEIHGASAALPSVALLLLWWAVSIMTTSSTPCVTWSLRAHDPSARRLYYGLPYMLSPEGSALSSRDQGCPGVQV